VNPLTRAYAEYYAKLIGKVKPDAEELEEVLQDGKKAIRDLIKSGKDLVKPSKAKKELKKSGEVKESIISEGTEE
jgi:hypothetical protein